MRQIALAVLLFPMLAIAQEAADTMVEAPIIDDAALTAPATPPVIGEPTPGAAPATPFLTGPVSEDANTLRVVQALQERKAVMEARAAVEEARGRFRHSECEANRGCASGAATAVSGGNVAPPPAAAVRQAIDTSTMAGFSVAGIYQRPGGRMSADLFVNGGRVMVEEGSELPGGYKVSKISLSGVAVRSSAGKTIALAFAEQVDVRGR